jgi:hypothetical protein
MLLFILHENRYLPMCLFGNYKQNAGKISVIDIDVGSGHHLLPDT